MLRSSLTLLLCLLVGSALPAAAPPPAPSALLDREFLGMVIRDPWYDFNTNPRYPNAPNRDFQDTMGATLARAGVRWVRLDFHIPITYTGTLADLQAEISKNDYFIDQVAPRHGLKVLGLLSFDLIQGANPRELNSQRYVADSPYGGAVNQYMHAWLERALLIADRYRGRVAAYEVLNEENRLPQHGGSGPAGDAIAPQVMARLLTKFYRFCKNIDPTDQNHGCGAGTPIILGGLHPRGTSDSQGKIVMTDREYLRQVYVNAEGAFAGFRDAHPAVGFPVDGVGYHPYPEEISLTLADARINARMPEVRAVLEDVGDPLKPFWVTEVGYNVGFDVDGSRNPIPAQTEAGQAEFLRDVYTSLAARRLPGGQPEVANVFWFKYEDFPPATGANAQRWGVVRVPFVDGACPGGACYAPDGAPELHRAAFLAYRELAGLPVYRTYLPSARR